MDFKIEIGHLRTRITLESPTIITDPGGAQHSSWTSQGAVWAKWINAHGPESIQDGAVQAQKRATVTIRYRSDVTSTWSVIKGGERYEILSLDHVQERHAYLELQVQQMKASA